MMKLLHWTLILSLFVSQVILAANLVPCQHLANSNHQQHHDNSITHNKHDNHDKHLAHHLQMNEQNQTIHTEHMQHSKDASACCGDDCACSAFAFQSYTLTYHMLYQGNNPVSDAVIYAPFSVLETDLASLFKPPSRQLS